MSMDALKGKENHPQDVGWFFNSQTNLIMMGGGCWDSSTHDAGAN